MKYNVLWRRGRSWMPSSTPVGTLVSKLKRTSRASPVLILPAPWSLNHQRTLATRTSVSTDSKLKHNPSQIYYNSSYKRIEVFGD